MRNLTLTLWAAGVLLAAAVAADGPIVIRPQPSGTSLSTSIPADPAPLQRPVVTHTDPNRPGFLIVRPQMAGGTVLEPIRQPGTVPPPAAPVTPTPVGEPKPAVIPEPGETPAAPPAASAQAEDGKLILETWDAVYLKGQRVGYFHVTVREYVRDGKTFVYATKAQKISVARFGQVVEQLSEDATTELADGTVLTTMMVQQIGRDQKLSLSGKVTGKTLTVTVTGAPGGTQQVPWPAGVTGVAKEATLLADRKPKPGESVEYLSYEGRLNRAVRFTAAVRDEAEITLVQGEKPRKVLRVVVSMDPIGDFKLPPSTLYVDAATYEPLRMDTDVPMLGGRMTVLRTTKEIAIRPVGKVPDLFDVQSIALDKTIPNVHDQVAVVYRVATNGTVPADKVFPTDGRQAVTDVDPAGKWADYRIAADRPGRRGPREAGRRGVVEQLLHRLGRRPRQAAGQGGRGRAAGDRDAAGQGAGRGTVGEPEHAGDRVQPGDGELLERGQDAQRRLHRVRDAERRHVPGAGGAEPDGDRAGVRAGGGRQGVFSLPHVVRGVGRRPLGAARRDARPRRHRPRPHQDHGVRLARRAVVRPAAAGADRARGRAEGRRGEGRGAVAKGR